jgi:hypothetical protein
MMTHAFELRTDQILKLIGSVIKLASTDVTLVQINSVMLRRQGNYLTATTTDRYAIGMCRDYLDPNLDAPADGWRFGLPLADAKALLTFARKCRASKITVVPVVATDTDLTVGHDALFKASGNSEFLRDEFPNVWTLLGKMLKRDGGPDLAGVYVERFTQFYDAQRIADSTIGGRNPMTIWKAGLGDSPAWALKIGTDFIGVVMGCRLGDTTDNDVSDWGDLL